MSVLTDWTGFWRRPWADPEAIRALRDRRIRKLVRHASENVPYYRRLFEEAGVRPEQIQCAEDLSLIPITTKRRRQLTPTEDKLAQGVDPRRCQQHRTSGSTGQPALVLRTWREDQVLLLHRLRAAVQLGARPHHRNVNVGISDTRRRLPHRLGLFPLTLLDAFLEPREMVRELIRIRPDFIRARPNVLELVLAEDTDQELRRIGTKIVFCGSETMAPVTRRRIEEAFGSRVIDIYGAHEFNMMAWSCPDCGCYHTMDDAVYLEVIKDGRPAGPGEEGDVVATALHSFAAPYIRFETGDVARIPATPPACGVSFGAIESLQGRACEFIRLGDGRRIHPTETFHAVREVEGVGRFEVAQTARDTIRITVEPLSRAEDPCPEVLRRCRRIFGDGVTIEIGSVAELAPQPSEKHRFIRALES
jgi:phenylacetate-CoA ligase